MAKPIGERVSREDDLMTALRFNNISKKTPGAWMRGAADRSWQLRRGGFSRLSSTAMLLLSQSRDALQHRSQSLSAQ
jgi:hypothetical protein